MDVCTVYYITEKDGSLTKNEAVGTIIGLIFGMNDITAITTAYSLLAKDIAGATNIIRFGPGPNGMLRTLGQYMLGSAATFGYSIYVL